MTILLSISGLFKTVLILIGVLVLLRFVGQLMVAKRNVSDQNAMKEQQEREKKAKEFVEKNEGKIFLSKDKNQSAVDVDFEEV